MTGTCLLRKVNASLMLSSKGACIVPVARSCVKGNPAHVGTKSSPHRRGKRDVVFTQKSSDTTKAFRESSITNVTSAEGLHLSRIVVIH